MRLRRNRARVVTLARISAMGSAAKMPNTLPVIRGRGRRLFQEGLPPTALHLDRCTVADGIPILEYSRRGR